MKIDPIELEQENIDVSTSSSDTLAQEAAEVVPESSDLLGDPSIAGFDASKTNNEEVSPSNEIKAPVLPNEPVDPQEWDHDMLESFTQQLNAIKQSLEAEKNEIIAELRRTTTELHETKKALSEAEARILKLEEDRATFNRSQDIMTSGRKGKLDILASAQSSSSPPPSITLPGVPMEVDPYTIAPWTDEETAKIKISAALGKPTTVTFDLSDTRRILHESNAFGSFLNQFPPLETIAHEDEKFSVIWKVLSYACFHGWNDVVFDYIINAKAPTLTFLLPQHLRNVDRIQLMQSVFQYLVEKRAFIQWGQAFHESLECWIAGDERIRSRKRNSFD